MVDASTFRVARQLTTLTLPHKTSNQYKILTFALKCDQKIRANVVFSLRENLRRYLNFSSQLS